MTLNYFQKLSRLVLICFCLFSFQANAQADFVSQLTEFSNDGINWNNSSRNLSDYDENGWVTELQLQLWNAGSWVNDDHEINTYNTNGTIAQKVKKVVDTDEPDSYSRVSYTYSATQKPTFILREWLNNTVWEISGKTEYVYNANDKLISETNSYLNPSGDYVYSGRFLYEYNADGYEVMKTNQLYNNMEGFYTWYTIETTYDSLNRKATITQRTFYNDEISSTIIQYNYFIGDTNKIDYNIRHGAQFTDPMLPIGRAEYTYNADDTVHQDIYYTWDGNNWKAMQRHSYFYQNLSTNEFKKQSLTAWPNPFQNALNIKADKTVIGSPYTIYNILGETVHSGIITSEETTIESQIKTAGTYFVRIGNSTEAIKVIKK